MSFQITITIIILIYRQNKSIKIILYILYTILYFMPTTNWYILLKQEKMEFKSTFIYQKVITRI